VPVLISLLPVFVFLVALIGLDTYKLIKPHRVLIAVAYGCAAAGLCYFINRFLMAELGLQVALFTRYVGPGVEEVAKAAFVIVLIARHKLGFPVDASIAGFSVGAGFAAIENMYYLGALGDVGLGIWFVRGFGTAVMHGGTTAVLAIITLHMIQRRNWNIIPAAAAGLVIAYALHSGFNHFPLRPVPMTLLQLAVLPAVVAVMFQRSENYTQEWLGTGFDTDQELLKYLTRSGITDTRVGDYLDSLREQFAGQVVADMLCYLRIHIELSIKAKGTLLMSKSGFKVTPDATLKRKFNELEYLKKSIGRTGILALAPFIHTSSRDLWQIHFVKQD